MKKKSIRLGILGAGKIGESIIKGLCAEKSEFKILASTRSKASAKEIARAFKVATTTDNKVLIENSDVIVLCVKPHQAKEVLESNAASFSKQKLLISVCAAIDTNELLEWSGGKPAVIRAMPNTPAFIREGMTVITAGKNAKESHTRIAENIFGKVGRTVLLEESLMDAATGLSGCGPAYVYLILEALSEAGVKVGLNRKVSTLLAAQTMLGAAKMVLEQDAHPAALKDEVTTPAGCTIDGLMELEEGKVRIALIKAVIAATKRSQKMA